MLILCKVWIKKLMRNSRFLLMIICSSLAIVVGANGAPPEQVHLATTGIASEMVIQWGTQEDTTLSCPSDSNVEYGTDSNELNQTASGDNDMYLWTTAHTPFSLVI